MRFRILPFAIVSGFLLMSSSCEEEGLLPGELNIEFVLVQNGEEFALGDHFTNSNLDSVRLDKLRFYLANLALPGSNKKLSSVEIIDFESGKTQLRYGGLTPGIYTGLTLGVGLDSVKNASNPLDFSGKHPLSAYWGMYWSWASKYRFVVLEGRGNENGTIGGSDDILISIHTGGSENYQATSFNNAFEIPSGGRYDMVIEIDVDKIWGDSCCNPIDLRTDHQSHGEPGSRELAVKFSDNFIQALSIR